MIGRPLRRREDARLLRGGGRYVADLRFPGLADAVFVHGEHAHAVLNGVDLVATRLVPGVVGAWAAAELDAPATPPMQLDPTPAEGRAFPALAVDRVRFAGQPVAIVVAENRYAAEDGRDAAVVDMSPLPALLDPTEAAGSDVQLFPGLSNVAADRQFGAPVPDAVWASAALVVEAAYRQPLVSHVFMESRAILVHPSYEGRLTVWVSHQAPHRLRNDLATVFGLAHEDVRVIVQDVGGAFGGKSATFPEYLAVVAAARRLGRPVRWLEDRAESLTGSPRGRGQNQRVKLATDADGRILAYRLEMDADVGGYPHTGTFIPMAASLMAGGAYDIPQLHVRTRSVVTTTAPTTPYRGAGRPEAAYAIERTLDEAARRLGLDPGEIRRRNFLAPAAFPYKTHTGYTYDSGNYAAALDLALRTVDYGHWRAEQAARRATGGLPLGIGLCTYVERSGAGEEYGAVEAFADGSFTAWSGCCSTGQGHATAFPQVVASVLGVEPDRIDLVEADTAVVPRGVGTFASRSMQTGGAALHRAATALVDEGRKRMADVCGTAPGTVHYGQGTFTAGDRTASFADLITDTGPLRVEDVFAPPEAFPFGAYIAVVEVEPELGEVRILRIVAVDDVGVVVNPLLVDGQMHGSVVQGLGQVLYEEVTHDEQGRPTSTSLLDYLIPTLSEVPPLTFEETHTPNPNTPLGAKGAGEAGCIGVPPAVVNAVLDALRLDDPTALQMPLTPRNVWKAYETRAV
jgi:carbon-monoxide dehydrogenase large subunit